MDSYFDIKAIPDPELLQSAVIGQLMQVVHGLLPAFEGRVGLAFPGYGQSRTLGGILRLHGMAKDLEKLAFEISNQATIRSYALVCPLAEIPGHASIHVEYQRLHTKGQSHYRRLEARHKARETWTSELEHAIAEKYREAIHCPHVTLKSKSNGNRFLMFIAKKLHDHPVNGSFNDYGLSVNGSTLPLF